MIDLAGSICPRYKLLSEPSQVRISLKYVKDDPLQMT